MHPVDRGLARSDPGPHASLGPGARQLGSRRRRGSRGGTSASAGALVPVIDLSTPWGMTLALLPELLLSAWALGLTLYAGVRNRDEGDQQRAGWIALAGLLATLLVVIWMWAAGARSAGGPLMMGGDGVRRGSSPVFLLRAPLPAPLSLPPPGRERGL